MTIREPILFCWSGGKDSAMALHALLEQQQFHVTALLTTVTEGYERISMHGVRRELLELQAASIGLPLDEVRIPPQCANSVYEARRFRAIAVCIDPKVLDRSFAGRELDDSFFRDLPGNADPCGENGEFHTFVCDGPVFRRPVSVRTGEIVHRDGFVFCDLLPDEQGVKNER